MSDYPDSIVAKAAEAIERELMSGRVHGGHIDSDEALARAALNAVAEDLGEHVAKAILAHMEATTPALRVTLGTGAQWRRNMRRIHYQTAARVAASAFLTEDDIKMTAARELAAGDGDG